MTRRLLVTGCARASTGYWAQLLTNLGLACGHELVFNPARAAAELHPGWPAGVPAESSWLAAPYLDQLPGGTVVVHVVREPQLALASLWRVGLFRTRSLYRAFAEQHCAALRDGTPQERTARYWTRWNCSAERARDRADLRYVRVRAGAVDEAVVRWIHELLERDVEPAAVRRALAATPRDFNTAGDRSQDAVVDWSPLAGGALAAELGELAERYGFERPSFAQPARSGPCAA